MDKQTSQAIARTSALRSNVVQVSVPAKIAFDLGRIQEVQKDILGRLGHPACYSGFDIRFDLERQFHVDEAGKVRSGF